MKVQLSLRQPANKAGGHGLIVDGESLTKQATAALLNLRLRDWADAARVGEVRWSFRPMKIVYRISEQDFTSAHDLFAANEKLSRRLSRRLLPWEGASVLVSLIFYLIAAPQWNGAFVIGGLAFWLCVIYFGFSVPPYLKRQFRKEPRIRDEFTPW